MIRATTVADVPTLIALATETGVFKPHELVALQEVLDDYFASNHALGHRALTLTDSHEHILGFGYHAPAAMTDRTWYMYWLAVRVAQQRAGWGSQLVAAAEADIRAANGRLLLIETSGTPLYEPTRQFYLRRGYHLAARLADFYADGDDLMVYAKRL
jgi:ribosomal protein S18 acetylase RimI-like enzyme